MLNIRMPNLWRFFAVSVMLSACGGGNEINNPTASPTTRPNISCVNAETLPDVIREFKQLNSGQCYLVERSVRIDSSGTLVINGNTKIQFESGGSINVNGGALWAEGTPTQPILFTGTREITGHWQGIAFHHLGNVASFLRYAIVEYAGGVKFLGLDQRASAIALLGAQANQGTGIGQIFITNNLITKSGGYGIGVMQGSPLADFKNNVISDNALAPLWLPADLITNLDSSNNIVNNEFKIIEVHDGIVGNRTNNSSVTPSPHVWHNHGNIPYQISRTLELYSPLEIAPGTTLQFGEDTELRVNSTSAYLKAVGKPGQEIVFTGSDPTPGHWIGLDYSDSVHSNNSLEFVRIEFAGASKKGRSIGSAGAAIFLGGATGSQISVSNSQLTNSAGYGFLVDKRSNFKRFTRNVVANNFLNPGSLPLPGIETLAENNSLFGNIDDRIRVSPSEVGENESIRLKKIGIPYWFEKHFSITGTVYVDPGVTLQFNGGAGLNVNGTGSSLIAKGTPSEPVTFTSSLFNNFPSWPGITFNNGSTRSVLENVVVEYGGGPYQPQNTGNIRALGNSQIELKNSIIRYGVNYGLWIENSTINQQGGVEFYDNVSGNSNLLF